MSLHIGGVLKRPEELHITDIGEPSKMQSSG